MDYDNEVMDNLAAARQAVADAKAELEESKAAEESAKADLETQKADLVKEQASVEATIQEVTSQSSVYAQKMDELEDDSASVSSQIAQAEKTYQAQIAAQKKAEEEAARKKAEEEAKKQQQQQNQNNSNSNSNSKPSGGGGHGRFRRLPVAVVGVYPGVFSLWLSKLSLPRAGAPRWL